MKHTKQDYKKIKSKKAMFIAYIAITNLALVILLGMFINNRNTITKTQAMDLALGFALKECLAKKNPAINCASVKVDEPVGSCFEWYCRDAPMWSVYYETTSGKQKFSGVINLNRLGEYIPEEKLNDYT